MPAVEDRIFIDPLDRRLFLDAPVHLHVFRPAVYSRLGYLADYRMLRLDLWRSFESLREKP